MPIIVIKASGAVAAGQVVKAQEMAIDLSSSIAGNAPANKLIATFPRDGIGTLRFRVGAGAGSFELSLMAGDTPGLIRPVKLQIAGPGDYLWPTSRKALALGLTRIMTTVAPGGSITPTLLSTKAMAAGDGAVGVLGIANASAADGATFQVTTFGPALTACSGGWLTGDALCSAAAGKMRRIAPGETGVDRVAFAIDDREDGETSCPVSVNLVLL
jgi:hypothetical protein